MKISRTFTLLLIILISNNLSSQYNPSVNSKNNDEIQTLEKLDYMMEKDRENEINAKKRVLEYRNEIRNEIRNLIPSLPTEKTQNLIKLENVMWMIFTDNLKNISYLEFYQSYYTSLEEYKNVMLNEITKSLKK